MTKRSELVLPPGTYAYSLDRANAKMSVLVGPLQNKLEEQEGVVTWDRQKGRMVGCPLDRAIQPIVIVPADSYAIVSNPCIVEGKLHQPLAKHKTQVDEVSLQYGRTEHVTGPTALIPWPGQEIEVRKRFQLERDQYIRVEVMEALSADATDRLNAMVDEPVSGYAIGKRLLVTGRKTASFTPPTGTVVIGNQVQKAHKLEAFEWLRLVADDGSVRYVRGPTLLFPQVNETIAASGKAIDLSRSGVHIRRLVDSADGPAGQETFLTCYLPGDDVDPDYWWPENGIELIEEVSPLDIPEGGGLYVRPRAGGKVTIHKAPAPVLFNPRDWELVSRDDSLFAPAVVVPDNSACEIISPLGSRVVIGPEVTLLEFIEQEGDSIPIMERREVTTEYAETSDGVSIFANISYSRTLASDPAGWFRATSKRHQVEHAIEQLFQEAAQQLTAAQVEANARLLQDAFRAPNAFDALAPEVVITNVDVYVQFAEPEMTKAVEQNRRAATLNRLNEQQRYLTQQEEKAQHAYQAALDELKQAAVERTRLTLRSETQSKLEAEKAELEAKKSMQDVLDELTTYELDREARRNQQLIEYRKREVELERQKLEAHAAANVEVLQAIQPHLVEAIRAAGAQTNFGKVVQHLGPAAILQGIGLQDALSKLIGNDAAASLLLTDAGSPDKSNGRTKRQSAEP